MAIQLVRVEILLIAASSGDEGGRGAVIAPTCWGELYLVLSTTSFLLRSRPYGSRALQLVVFGLKRSKDARSRPFVRGEFVGRSQSKF